MLEALRDKSAYDSASGGDMTDTLFQKGIAAGKVLRDIHVETGVAFTKQIEAQENLVQSLEAQVRSEQRIAEIKEARAAQRHSVPHIRLWTKRLRGPHGSALKSKTKKLDREYLQNVKHGQEDLINATQEGSTDRLSALQAAMDETAALYGRDNETYKQYANEYLRTWNQMSAKTLDAISRELEEEDRLKAEAGREAAANSERMGELSVARLKMSLELREQYPARLLCTADG